MRSCKESPVTGDFVTLDGERYYVIRHVDQMPPFFISLVSDHDSWMFVASNGGLTAGRESPDNAIFPYITVDKIYDSAAHTGSTTLIRVSTDDEPSEWEPFNYDHNDRYKLTRNLYKNTLGNKLIFEEINEDLQIKFAYSWSASEAYGFVRTARIENLGDSKCQVELIDGLRNILPAGTPRFAQTNTSNLVDAYKWSELDEATGLAFFTLFSGISDRAEPCESLRSTTAFCVGLEDFNVLLSDQQLDCFRAAKPLTTESKTRGVRGAYLIHTNFTLPARVSQQWRQVIDANQSQCEAVTLLERLTIQGNGLAADVDAAVERSTDRLARIMGRADAYQHTDEEHVSTHHYANVLFNVLRGGIVDDQYEINKEDFVRHIGLFSAPVSERHQAFLDSLDSTITFQHLLELVRAQSDAQLERLTLEYLPITFGRRHGDPSRPWNLFSIRLADEHGNRLLTYEGNWRDIFQNWEALLLSYPEFIESVITKFVNASTVDGYNPYRITNEGIDWEVEDAEDPWSYIGYWGDHQIIYLQKLLELSRQFHPQRLKALLHKPLFCYANVPYRIKDFEALRSDAKNTIDFDHDLADRIEKRVADVGADGKLVTDTDGSVYQVTLLEKLLVPLLAKLSNLVPGGGIWLNTQRPEWNDANNALVGHGLSMVTLYYLRRHLEFLKPLMDDQTDPVHLSTEVARWLNETAKALRDLAPSLKSGELDTQSRYTSVVQLGEAASRYRMSVYAAEGFSGTTQVDTALITGLIDDAIEAANDSIRRNRRPDGLYHAYNLIHFERDTVEVEHLYTMLEGQVAALSSGAIGTSDAANLLDALFKSDIYREDQQSFLLYPDRQLPGYLEKNKIPAASIESHALLLRMLGDGDRRLVQRDIRGTYRFSPGLINAGALDDRIDALLPDYGKALADIRSSLHEIYEDVFDHKAFTGRSGGMFGFEGLGCIYWHMVSKLLLAVQENFFAAADRESDATRRIGEHYYRVRAGIGFNKTPLQYGAFPTDPYSHTPGHAGAQQPGMTGQVKEEIITRFGELGIHVSDGCVRFDPALLLESEFCSSPGQFRYLDIGHHWQQLAVPARSLAFTWCQVPLLYTLDSSSGPAITISWADGRRDKIEALALPSDIATEIFHRTGQIEKLELTFHPSLLFKGQVG